MLKVGVVGLGNMGRYHVQTYHALPETTVSCLCDIRPEIVQTFASEYQCQAYTDLEQMLAQEKPAALSLTAPTSLHYAMAKKIIQKGIPLLIEKPLADSLEKSEELIALAKQHNVLLMVGHIERFNPAISKLKELVTAGDLGEIVSISTRRLGTFPSQIKDANVLIDLAVHDIDICSWLLNQKPQKIVQHASRALINDRADCAEIFLDYGRASALVQVNWITPIRVRTLQIHGTKAFAELDYIQQELALYPLNYRQETDQAGNNTIKFAEPEKIQVPVPKEKPLTLELAHFLDCVRHNHPPLVTGEAGKLALQNALGQI